MGIKFKEKSRVEIQMRGINEQMRKLYDCLQLPEEILATKF